MRTLSGVENRSVPGFYKPISEGFSQSMSGESSSQPTSVNCLEKPGCELISHMVKPSWNAMAIVTPNFMKCLGLNHIWSQRSRGLVPGYLLADGIIGRRKFRSETSDSMDTWKSRGGKSQKGEEKKREDQRGEKGRRKKMQVRKKVGKSRFTVILI